MCRPTDSGSVMLHTPSFSARITDLVSSQSLKSPTSETFPAVGATKTNLTTVSVGETGDPEATGDTSCPAGGRPPRFDTKAPASTPIPTRPAASSEPAAGDIVHDRGAMTRAQMA